PEVHPVVAGRLDLVEPTRPEEGPDPGARRDRHRGLPGDDVQVLVPGEVHVADVPLLEDLPLREGRADAGGEIDDVVVQLPADRRDRAPERRRSPTSSSSGGPQLRPSVPRYITVV